MVAIDNNHDRKRERVARMPDRRYAYFRDDQITFLVTHRQEQLTESDLQGWGRAIKPFLNGGNIVWPPRWFSFRALQDNEYLSSDSGSRGFTRSFSIIICDMENVPQDPLTFLEFISNLTYRRDSKDQGNKDDQDNRNVVSIVGKEFAGLRVESVSPNWLASGASQGGATGGPGGWPVPFRGNPSRAPYHFRELLCDLKKNHIYGEGEGVDVVVLDTAPCPHDLVAAYKEYKGWHPLIRTLLGPNGKLKLYPATYEENLRMGSTSLNEHDYKMTDHGLFSAGIIHSIVPKATIHLIEVLNPLGVSDLGILAAGFHKVFSTIYQRPRPDQPEELRRKLVINCSWMLEPPLVATHRRDPDSQFEEKVMDMAQSYWRLQAFFLKTACDLFDKLGRQVIAAAGNDWRENGDDRIAAPITRYPAAFLGTFGVAAHPRVPKLNSNGKYEVSSYANLADIPDNTKRIITLGGEEGEEKGVLGLYLGEFPGCEPNPNCTKWAWWAGTSFATPILTGAIAAVLSSHPRFPGVIYSRTQDAVDALYKNKIIEPRMTDANEDVMCVKQDYKPS